MRKTVRLKTVQFMALILALMLCFALTACGGEQGKTTESDPEQGSSKSQEDGQSSKNGTENKPTGPVAAGDDYRDFTATLADGSTFTLSDHEGSVILLNFWATWCGPCVGEMPAFPRLVEKYGDDLTLIAVDLGEDAKTVENFLERNGYEFSVALDPAGDIGSLYPTDGIPYTVLIGRDCKIVSVHLGADKADIMYEVYCGEIDELLEE